MKNKNIFLFSKNEIKELRSGIFSDLKKENENKTKNDSYSDLLEFVGQDTGNCLTIKINHDNGQKLWTMDESRPSVKKQFINQIFN